jgi:integrase
LAFQSASDRAGLPRSRFHDLRHATVTFLPAQGMTLEDVKQLPGHSSITMTSNTYRAVSPDGVSERGAGGVLAGLWRVSLSPVAPERA